MGEMKPLSLIKKGAEANLYLVCWYGRKAVLKQRICKKYRPAKLDEEIRTYRTVHEPQLMHEAKQAGVSTPTILLVDVKNTSIIMDYIEGRQVKLILNEIAEKKRRKLCYGIGRMTALLHQNSIIHGDLTTSNMIVDRQGRIFFVDFGLGEKNPEIEAKGVDIHLMKRALQSTHYRIAEDCFEAVIEGYGSVVGARTVQGILVKVKEIERRGRYVAERKQKES